MLVSEFLVEGRPKLLSETKAMVMLKRSMMQALAAAILLCAAPMAIAAQENELKIPSEVAPFVERGTKAIALENADLNGDNRADFILVLEREYPEKDKYDLPFNQRPLLILVRGVDGKLALAKRNERIVMCSECGGVFGDPFESVEVARNSFTVHHYGGSAWRWAYRYKFNYSRIDQTWQLVRVEEISYHTSDPEKIDTRIYTPPKDFGKIDVADFDPEKYLYPGEFEGTYRVGETTCTVKPVKMAFEVRWAKGSGTMIFFADKESSEPNRFVSEDKGKGRDAFIFDTNRYETGIFIRADGKEMPIRKIK